MTNQSQFNLNEIQDATASYVESEKAAGAASTRTEAIRGSLATTTMTAVPAKGARSDLEIIGDILRIASRNSGESISVMRQRANLSQKTITRYLRLMLARNLLSLERPSDRNAGAVLYRPTELGYDFLLRQRELLALLDSEVPELFSFRDW